MIYESTPTIFDSFNARALPPTEVARSFVPSDHYARLVKRCHSILIGPRGSGKTTLLKMLQSPALRSWNHPLADKYRQLVDYTGVFVATDISWSAQLESLGGAALDPNVRRIFSVSAFTTHVLRAFIISFLNRIPRTTGDPKYRAVTLTAAQEREIVDFVATAWSLDPKIPSLLAVKQALRQRLVEIRRLANREAVLGPDGRSDRIGANRFLHVDFLEGVSAGIEICNDVLKEQDARWALLFDELELAPDWIQTELMRSLRSTDERILFKLALSPHSARAQLGGTALSASNMQDFEQIPLWYVSRLEGYKFCEDLWYSMLDARQIERTPPKQVLGQSYFETEQSEWKGHSTAYRANSRLGRRFLALAHSDHTFRSFLNERGIDPEHLENVTRDRRDAVVRKIGPLIAVRQYYRKRDLGGQYRISTRSRKSAALYSGAASLFAITEGNPRWFIGIVGRILDKWNGDKKHIEASVQGEEMIKASQRFAAMLRTIPSAAPATEVGVRGVLSLMKKVGDYFHEKVVLDDFTPEPPGSFIVDSHASKQLLDMLEQALNAGAVVFIPDSDGQTVLMSLKGKRFRPSYLLAPVYGFPVRVGPPISLTSVLTHGSVRDMKNEELPLEEGES